MNLGTRTAGEVPLVHFGGQCMSRGLEQFPFLSNHLNVVLDHLNVVKDHLNVVSTYMITWTTSLPPSDLGFADTERSLLLVLRRHSLRPVDCVPCQTNKNIAKQL